MSIHGHALVPGNTLVWRAPSNDEECYKPLYKLWRERHGETVTFVAYATKADPYNLHNEDIKSLPILRVKTRVGEIIISSDYFK